MSRTIDPTCYSTLDRICLSIVVCDIFREASLEERHFLTSDIKICVTDWYHSVSHSHTMLHRNVVKCLVPGEGRELVTLSELISQVQSSDSPLL